MAHDGPVTVQFAPLVYRSIGLAHKNGPVMPRFATRG
jgi:hypothetical protein